MREGKRAVEIAAPRRAEVDTRPPARREAGRAPPRWREAIRALRPHQWLKNLLVFVPLVAAHRVGDLTALGRAALALPAFCLAASAGYLVNDLFDLAADRRHPTKCTRPLAAGTLSTPHALLGTALLAIAAFATALPLGAGFLALLALYLLVSLAYSMHVKKVLILDVLVLAGLYTLRIIAGGVAIAVPLSFWLLAFSMFLFLSLAMAKRYTELLALQVEKDAPAPGRRYAGADDKLLLSLGGSNGNLAVLVLALYINSNEIRDLYARPQLIWLLCPLLLYWTSRIWLAAARGELDSDPIVYAIRDRRSRWVAVAALLVLLVAV